MSSFRFSVPSCFKTFVTLIFIFSLAACSVSQPESLLTDGLVSSSSVAGSSISSTGDDFESGASRANDDLITDDTSAADDAYVPGNNPSSSPKSSSPKKVFKVAWNAPLHREDGSNLRLAEIAEYRVYYGSKKGNYKNVIVVDGNSTLEAEDSGVPSGRYYVAVTTVDSEGRESAYSKEITVTV